MFANAIGAQIRRFEEREHEGRPARVVVAERVYPAEPGDIWSALTDAERIPRWFMPISGDLRLGGRYQLQGNAGGTITRCDPPRALDVTWEFAGGMSWVIVRLVAEGAGTRLTLEHVALTDVAQEHWQSFGPGAVGVGWDLALFGLGLYLAGDGTAVDHEQVERWSASPEGKAFMRSSADGWAQAHIAAGEEPAIAQGMAQRTAAFYCGE